MRTNGVPSAGLARLEAAPSSLRQLDFQAGEASESVAPGGVVPLVQPTGSNPGVGPRFGDYRLAGNWFLCGPARIQCRDWSGQQGKSASAGGCGFRVPRRQRHETGCMGRTVRHASDGCMVWRPAGSIHEEVESAGIGSNWGPRASVNSDKPQCSNDIRSISAWND